MTASGCPKPITAAEIVDYLTGEVSDAASDQIEEHVFTCAECAGRLEETEALGRRIAAAMREGRVHTLVTDAVLNRLARDGVRVRTYTVAPGDVVPCAVWADDDLVVTRIRADLTGVDSVTVVAQLEKGDEISRLDDVPIRAGQREIIHAIPAALLRQLPSARIRVTVSTRSNDVERALGECILQHAGTFDRASGHA